MDSVENPVNPAGAVFDVEGTGKDDDDEQQQQAADEEKDGGRDSTAMVEANAMTTEQLKTALVALHPKLKSSVYSPYSAEINARDHLDWTEFTELRASKKVLVARLIVVRGYVAMPVEELEEKLAARGIWLGARLSDDGRDDDSAAERAGRRDDLLAQLLEQQQYAEMSLAKLRVELSNLRKSDEGNKGELLKRLLRTHRHAAMDVDALRHRLDQRGASTEGTEPELRVRLESLGEPLASVLLGAGHREFVNIFHENEIKTAAVAALMTVEQLVKLLPEASLGTILELHEMFKEVTKHEHHVRTLLEMELENRGADLDAMDDEIAILDDQALVAIRCFRLSAGFLSLVLLVVVLISAHAIFSDFQAPHELAQGTGRVFNIKVDEHACMSAPCQNGGHCAGVVLEPVETDGPKTSGYECHCPLCASGPNCEVRNDRLCNARFENNSALGFNNSKAAWQARLKDHLLENHRADVRPVSSMQDPTLEVTVSIALRAVEDVNPAAGKWTAIIWLRATWTDVFLSWDPAEWGGVTEVEMATGPAGQEELWTPQMSILNAFHTPDIDQKPATVYPSGYVFWSQPMRVVLSCEMDLSDFPFDKQPCMIHIGGWTDHGWDVALVPDKLDLSGGW